MKYGAKGKGQLSRKSDMVPEAYPERLGAAHL
jgi:hypothetical protein